ncbi:MAG: GNAT family N-acetyltransferase [Gammaproteobacteria bacterium]
MIESISEVDKAVWNGLVGADYPFLRHEFLAALELSGSASPMTGWKARHALVFRRGELIALMPLYLKSHSNGEFVFDYQWADAYRRYGLKYYPKFLSAIPFTPCQGPRIVVKNPDDSDRVFRALLDSLREISEERDISSWHCLFPSASEAERLASMGLSLREGVQFQWINKGYREFDDFLQTLTASKRKMIKRERRKVREAGIELRRLGGNEVTEAQCNTFFQFYQMTYLKHGMRSYLNLDFFLKCAETMADSLLLVLALKKDETVGAALSFIGADTLYGRYWGCREEFDFLHFETCYYQGLDYCIEHALQRFDSGAQGEHKIARGFEPVTTYSVHWFKDAAFAEAIEHFLGREKKAVHNYKRDAAGFLPFKKINT